MAQRAFGFRTWGGKRKGRGAQALGAAAPSAPCPKRPVLKRRFPVHVTWRMRKDVPWLRKPRAFGALARAFWGGCNRFGFRLIHYSVQGNHMHLLVEARDEKSLARGMNGLGVRVARGLNKALGRHGKVLDERYHGHISADTDGGAARARLPRRTRGGTSGSRARIRMRRGRRSSRRSRS